MNTALSFEQSLRELITPIIKEAVNTAIEKYFIDYIENHPNEPDIIDLNGVIEYLGLKRSTVYTMTSKREIPHFKKGRKLLFKKSELDHWVAEGKRKTKREIGQEIDDYTARRWGNINKRT